jgi:hypothetical protein
MKFWTHGGSSKSTGIRSHEIFKLTHQVQEAISNGNRPSLFHGIVDVGKVVQRFSRPINPF